MLFLQVPDQVDQAVESRTIDASGRQAPEFVFHFLIRERMAGVTEGLVYLPAVGRASRRSDREPSRHGHRVAMFEFRQFYDMDVFHQLVETRIAQPFGAERIHVHAAIHEGHRHAVGEAVVGGFSTIKVPKPPKNGLYSI